MVIRLHNKAGYFKTIWVKGPLIAISAFSVRHWVALLDRNLLDFLPRSLKSMMSRTVLHGYTCWVKWTLLLVSTTRLLHHWGWKLPNLGYWRSYQIWTWRCWIMQDKMCFHTCIVRDLFIKDLLFPSWTSSVVSWSPQPSAQWGWRVTANTCR